MLGCLTNMQISPSLGFFMPWKRDSNLSHFSRSRTFRQTSRPVFLSRARNTFDMLPWPVRPRSSKRFSTLTTGSFPVAAEEAAPAPPASPPPPNRPLIELKRPTVAYPHRMSVYYVYSSIPGREEQMRPGCSVLAVIDDASDLGSQVTAVDDAVHEAVLEQELAGLEALGQLQADRVPDGPLAGEADERS